MFLTAIPGLPEIQHRLEVLFYFVWHYADVAAGNSIERLFGVFRDAVFLSDTTAQQYNI